MENSQISRNIAFCKYMLFCYAHWPEQWQDTPPDEVANYHMQSQDYFINKLGLREALVKQFLNVKFCKMYILSAQMSAKAWIN